MRWLVGGLILFSCLWSCSPAPSTSAQITDADVTTDKAKKEWPKDVAIYRNDKGEVVCPVMKDVIKDPGMAVGYQDYKGKRYYFCCGMCPEKFKANPEQNLK